MKRFIRCCLPLILMIMLGLSVNAESINDTTVIAMTVTNYLSLTVHGGIDLGTITSPTDVLESTGNSIRVQANVGYELTVEVQAVSVPADHPDAGGDYAAFLADLYVKGGDLTTYTFFTKKGSGGKLTIANTSSGGDDTYSMSYKYEADANDVPGNYSITLKYTVTSH